MKAQARLKIVRVSSFLIFWNRRNMVAEITKEVEIPHLPSIGEETEVLLTRFDGSKTQTSVVLKNVKYLLEDKPVLHLELELNDLSLMLAALNRGDGDTEKSLSDVVKIFLNSGWTHFE